MVLGFLLYELVDFGFGVAKLGYDGICSTYYWWYAIDTPEVKWQKKMLNEVELLNLRIKYLERNIKP